MDVAIFSAAVVGLAAFVALPLYRRSAPGPRADDAGAPAADAGRQAAEAALRDLEIDLATGLVDRSAYDRERAAIAAEEQATD